MIATGTGERPAVGQDPWASAWLLLVPLAIWLFLAKLSMVIVAVSGLGLGPGGEGLRATVKAVWEFGPVRFVAVALVAFGIQKLVFPRRRWAILPIAVVIFVAMALLATAMTPDRNPLEKLLRWVNNGVQHSWYLIASVWRDAVSVAMLALLFGVLLRLVPRRAFSWTVRLLQAAVALLCGVVGLNLSYELGTGQPASLRALAFGFHDLHDLLPIISSETTPFRVIAIAGGILLGIVWAWRHRRLATAPAPAATRKSHWGWGVALVGSLAILLPLPSVGYEPVEPSTQGVLLGLADTAKTAAADEAAAKVDQAFDATRQPPWHGAGMTIAATDRTRRMNVVIVMMESMRYESTTLGNPTLDTTPFLKQLAANGLVADDMSAVIPRTAAAWVAIQAGLYPLTNGATAKWAALNAKIPRLRGLPALLHGQGYATSFFTPTELNFQSDQEVIRSLGFDKISTEKDITYPGAERPTYFGVSDELMVEPLLKWTAAQVQAHRPFMTAIMTNVGHHDYRTPSTWKKIDFPGVSNPSLESYYNCLRYIDTVLSNLMQGYQRLGVLNDTIFMFLGDHGQLFGEHGVKQSFNAIYQDGVRIPMLIYAPGLDLKPGVIHGPRQQIDVLPTVLDMLGYRLDGGRLPGISMLDPVDPDRKLFFSSSIEWSALGMRDGRFKYIYHFGRKPMEVYDLASDPDEEHPLQDIRKKQIAQAQQDMLQWQAAAELSLDARPADPSNPSGPWLKN
ncbi:MAG: hypothetical protein OJF60_001045 [Burkholderiaceae bacterium]|jgi:arylsulfatase A-like enzyme/multisubunit Na+/H+ antiporter MnhB subunit|nr:MAG: hypothetical protein OJF60_001045 [Burkholderiaceae bacterium]